MVGHGGSSAGSYLADPSSPIPSHCASIVATSTVRVNYLMKKGTTVYECIAQTWSIALYKMKEEQSYREVSSIIVAMKSRWPPHGENIADVIDGSGHCGSSDKYDGAIFPYFIFFLSCFSYNLILWLSRTILISQGSHHYGKNRAEMTDSCSNSDHCKRVP